MISSRELSSLPEPSKLKILLQSIAMLDAIIEDKWGNRYYSYDKKWDKETELASMRNGSGDEYYAMFFPFGVIIKGFAHESAMSPYRNNPSKIWPGVLDYVPKEFSKFIKEPAILISDTTFCIWRLTGDTKWQRGVINYPDVKDPDGSEELLSIMDGVPETYMKWAVSYYEQKLSINIIRNIYAHYPITKSLVNEINKKSDLLKVMKAAEEIGY